MKNVMICIVVILLIVIIFALCKKETFCSVAPRYDYYYQTNTGRYVPPSAFPQGYVSGSMALPDCKSKECQSNENREDRKECPVKDGFKIEFAQNEFMDEEVNKNMKKLINDQVRDPYIYGTDYEGRALLNNRPVNPNYEGFQLGQEVSSPACCTSQTCDKDISYYGPRSNDLLVTNPIYRENGGVYPNYMAKDGIVANSDTIGSPFDSGCRRCGGDYISVAPKRDRYYQPEMGYLGDNIMSGYPFYKAI